MAIPVSELERLLRMTVNVSAIPSRDEIHFSDHNLGIERGWGGLKRNGESVNYSVPGYPYRQIAKWLNEHGVLVTFPSVYRFCERAIVRRPRNGSLLPLAESIFIQTPPIKNTQHRFNLEI